jgi:hypothetical protein
MMFQEVHIGNLQICGTQVLPRFQTLGMMWDRCGSRTKKVLSGQRFVSLGIIPDPKPPGKLSGTRSFFVVIGHQLCHPWFIIVIAEFELFKQFERSGASGFGGLNCCESDSKRPLGYEPPIEKINREI